MDITPYVERLRASLTAAAAAGGPEITEAAERLGAALDPAARLAFMEALSDAASELSSTLPDTTVRVVLDGRDLDFAVDFDEPLQPAPVPTGGGSEEEDDENVARLTLRLPESVKAKAEEMAARTGISLNSWVVGALKAATSHDGMSFDLGRFGGPRGRADLRPGGRPGGRRETGWI